MRIVWNPVIGQRCLVFNLLTIAKPENQIQYDEFMTIHCNKCFQHLTLKFLLWLREWSGVRDHFGK